MPFESIANAALILSGKTASLAPYGTPSKKPAFLGWAEFEENDLAVRIAKELRTAATLGKIAATKDSHGKISCIFSKIELEDARAFIAARGLVSPGSLFPEPPEERRRDKQLRLMQRMAAAIEYDLHTMKKGESAKLRDALQKEHGLLFSNWRDIWKEALRRKIASPIKYT